MSGVSSDGVSPQYGEGVTDAAVDQDARQLEELGYKSHFSRTMSLAANFSLGFTYLSPLVGVYTLFAFVVATGGAAAIWTYPIVMVGQLLVALVFAEVLSQYRIAGGRDHRRRRHRPVLDPLRPPEPFRLHLRHLRDPG